MLRFVSLLKGDNASLSTQIASATERIAQLESVVSALERGGSAQSQFGIETDPRFFDNRTFTEADTDFSALARTILGARSTSTSDPSGSALPAYEVAQFAVESFFTNYDLVYPFLDKHELVKDMELAYVRLSEAFVPSTDESKGREFVLYMVFALGTVGREVNGDVEKGTAQRFKERATSHLSLVLASESLVSDDTDERWSFTLMASSRYRLSPFLRCITSYRDLSPRRVSSSRLPFEPPSRLDFIDETTRSDRSK